MNPGFDKGDINVTSPRFHFRRIVLSSFFLLFLFISYSLPARASYFTQINKDGFGNMHNTGGLETKTMAVFQGKLFVGVSNQADGAQVWCFDNANWTQINESGFGSRDNIAISCMEATDQVLYAGTSNRNGGQAWSYNGKEWACLHQGRFGKTQSNAISCMARYRGRLYVGLWDQVTSRPAEVWSFDGEASWQQVNEPGYGSPYNLNTLGMEVSSVDGQEKLYAIVWKSFQYNGKDAGCDIWAYDEKKWVKVNAGREGFGEKGHGRAGMEPYAIAEFQGKLYVGLWGFGGGSIWEVWAYDGRNWARANSSVQGKGNFLLLCDAMIPFKGRLYAVAASGLKNEFELWSYDGKAWSPVIARGCATPENLGDPNNKIINAMAVYKDRLYLGVANDKSGYRIFESRFPEISPRIKSVAVGDTELFTLQGSVAPVTWFSDNPRVLLIDQQTGFAEGVSPGKCLISGTDASGYRSDPLPVIVTKETRAAAIKKVLIFAEAQPRSLTNSGSEKTVLTARIYKTRGVGNIDSVQADLSPVNRGTLSLFDDGTHGDRVKGDGIYSCEISVPADAAPGTYSFMVRAREQGGVEGTAAVFLSIKQRYTVPEITAVRTMGSGYHIPILFELKDPDKDVCSVAVEYKQKGGSWLPASIASTSGQVTAIINPQAKSTLPAKGNVIKNLATPEALNQYVCVWQSEKNIGHSAGTFSIRVTPDDSRSGGTATESKPFHIDNSKPPADEMVYVPAGKFFIDKYEYPNHFGYYPEVSKTWYEARKACQERGRDLCTTDQWEKAYYGTSKKRYPYGDTYGFEDRKFCNTNGSADDVPTPAGMYENCVNDLGIYDMGGNVYEWAGLDEKNTFMADQSYKTSSMIQSLFNVDDPHHRHEYLGFRCCTCEQ